MMEGQIALFDGEADYFEQRDLKDKNEAALGLKIFGFILMILGGIVLYFNY